MKYRNVCKDLKKHKCKSNLRQQKSKTQYQELEDTIKKILSPAQISRLKGTGRKKHWQKEDIVSALGIFKISKKAYNYTKNKMAIPLPSASTIRRWLKEVKVDEGFIDSSFKLLGVQYIETASDIKSKVVILSFDEMSLKNEHCYDPAADRVYMPKKKAQVIFVRGLFKRFKIPIFVGFDTRMTKEILYEAMLRIEQEGFLVKGIVCDQATENVKLMLTLGINGTQNYIKGATDSMEKVFVFYDVPHAIKNIRNHIVDQGLKLPSGNILSKEVFFKLLKVDAGEFKICPKLTYGHVNVKGQDRQRVLTAVQLLSNTTLDLL